MDRLASFLAKPCGVCSRATEGLGTKRLVIGEGTVLHRTYVQHRFYVLHRTYSGKAEFWVDKTCPICAHALTTRW
ncbi:hypothetical protein Pla22_14740 [Rubripirellula amarantea]|uniref:Uncharacterized protein n=1 Tax=Rubripirellula amarantea TaxID=2527999 RepID=A0A5C5WTK7_9BACT|nr:hypothetical protein Pla22_14740 [Rubripirellula amarantea]